MGPGGGAGEGGANNSSKLINVNKDLRKDFASVVS